MCCTWRDLETDAKHTQLPLSTDILGPFNESCEVLDWFRDVSHTEGLGGWLEERVLGLGCSGGLHAVGTQHQPKHSTEPVTCTHTMEDAAPVWIA